MAFALRSAVPYALRPVANSLRPFRAASTNLRRPFGKPLSEDPALHRTPRFLTVTRARSGATVMAAVAAESFYDFKVKDIDGRDADLSKYRGKVVLVVNVASQCGFTPQYKELAELYNKYKGQGLVIIGFPCNQFGGQEPGSNSDIKRFAEARGANFPMMEKVDVNGDKAAPVYNFLKSKQGGFIVPEIKWNFTKFLLDKEGNVVKRYGSTTTPGSIEDDIKSLL